MGYELLIHILDRDISVFFLEIWFSYGNKYPTHFSRPIITGAIYPVPRLLTTGPVLDPPPGPPITASPGPAHIQRGGLERTGDYWYEPGSRENPGKINKIVLKKMCSPEQNQSLFINGFDYSRVIGSKRKGKERAVFSGLFH